MTKMLYHNDSDWYERPGETVDIPLGPALTRSRAYVVPALPWKIRKERAHGWEEQQAIDLALSERPNDHSNERTKLPLDQQTIAGESIDPESTGIDG